MTRPSGSSVAVWVSRAVVIEPVGLKPGVGDGKAVSVGVGVGVGVASGVDDAAAADGVGLSDGVALSIGLGVAVTAVQAARLAPINRTAISRPTLA